MTDWTDETDEGVGGNMSSDDAAWRELIAHYELPAAPDPAAAPWPERENLDNHDPSPQAAEQPASGDQAAAGGEEPPGLGDAPEADTAGASDTETPGADDADTPEAGTPGSTTDSGDRRPGGAGSDRTRVVRPASPSGGPQPTQRRRRTISTSRRPRHRCRASTRSRKAPGPPCSADLPTCSLPRSWAGRCPAWPRWPPLPHLSAASPWWSSGWVTVHRAATDLITAQSCDQLIRSVLARPISAQPREVRSANEACCRCQAQPA